MAERGGRQDEHRQQKQSQEDIRERETEGLRARLDKLSEALDAQRKAETSSNAAKREEDGTNVAPGSIGTAGSIGSAMGLATRVLSEFVTAVIVGALIGWGIDRVAGTSPAFLIVLLLMGAAAGFWNVYRIAVKPPEREG